MAARAAERWIASSIIWGVADVGLRLTAVGLTAVEDVERTPADDAALVCADVVLVCADAVALAAMAAARVIES